MIDVASLERWQRAKVREAGSALPFKHLAGAVALVLPGFVRLMLRTAGPNRLALRDPDADCETGANLSPVTPQLRDIRQDYTHNFEGMTEDPVPLDALIATRERLVRQVQRELDADERRFLLSLVRAEPEWPLLGIAHLEHLPGVRWKLQNLLQLRKDNARKFAEQADALVAGLESVH